MASINLINFMVNIIIAYYILHKVLTGDRNNFITH